MPADSAAVVNIALEQIASQTKITSLTDGTTAANAALVVYQPTVQLVMRELDPDFARFTATLTLSSAVTPITPWSYEYLYPTDCVRLRQVRPPSGAYDVNNPIPVNANVAFDMLGSPAVATKVILTDVVNALAVYTSSNASETLWDALFTDAVARRLANPLAMALSGRPDFAREILQEANQVMQAADMFDDGAFRRAG